VDQSEEAITDRELKNAPVTLQQTVAERDRLEQAFPFLNQPETRRMNFGQGQQAPQSRQFLP
jgi:hypothetical protein